MLVDVVHGDVVGVPLASPEGELWVTSGSQNLHGGTDRALSSEARCNPHLGPTKDALPAVPLGALAYRVRADVLSDIEVGGIATELAGVVEVGDCAVLPVWVSILTSSPRLSPRPQRIASSGPLGSEVMATGQPAIPT